MPPPLHETLADEAAASEAMDLLLAGKTMREAGAILGVAHTTVSRRVAMAHRAFREKYLATKYEEWAAESLQRLEWAQREAAQAWRRSIGEVVTVTVRQTDDGKERTEKIETQAGDPRYLDTYLRAEQRRADLLGLDAPKRIDMGIAPGFIGNPEREAAKAGMSLEEAHAMIEAALGGQAAS